jgi:hypothetical protein
MSKNIFWNPKLVEHEIMGKAMDRLVEVGEAMAVEVKKNTPEGSTSRPMYKTGPYKNKYWTARDAGALKKSVRTTRRPEAGAGNANWKSRNVWVMVGTTKAYYSKIIEFGVNSNKYKGFFRKAINRSRKKARNILTGK